MRLRQTILWTLWCLTSSIESYLNACKMSEGLERISISATAIFYPSLTPCLRVCMFVDLFNIICIPMYTYLVYIWLFKIISIYLYLSLFLYVYFFLYMHIIWNPNTENVHFKSCFPIIKIVRSPYICLGAYDNLQHLFLCGQSME